MKFVKCIDCNKEIKFTDAVPCWDIYHPSAGPNFLCKKCRITNKEYQPERLNPEDTRNGVCDSLNSSYTQNC